MNNNGFTLSELMIVISIVGLLASVTIPSTIGLQSSVKEQQVISNISVIRGYLEVHSVSRSSDSSKELNKLLKDLYQLEKDELSKEHFLENPFTNGKKIVSGTSGSLSDDVSVVVYSEPKDFDGEFKGGPDKGKFETKGKIYIQVYNDAYVIWGRDRNGESICYQVIT